MKKEELKFIDIHKQLKFENDIDDNPWDIEQKIATSKSDQIHYIY